MQEDNKEQAAEGFAYKLKLRVKSPENWLDEHDVMNVIIDIIQTHTAAVVTDASCHPEGIEWHDDSTDDSQT